MKDNYTQHHIDSLNKAIDYLRSRNIYVADYGNKFIPTNAATTDVSQTIARYRQQTQGVNLIRRAK